MREREHRSLCMAGSSSSVVWTMEPPQARGGARRFRGADQRRSLWRQVYWHRPLLQVVVYDAVGLLLRLLQMGWLDKSRSCYPDERQKLWRNGIEREGDREAMQRGSLTQIRSQSK